MSRHRVDKLGNMIDRKTAAQILSISQRTLDRYIKNKKVYSRKANGRIWLDDADIRRFKAKREAEILGDVNNLYRRHSDVKSDQNYGITHVDTGRQGLSTSMSTLSTLSTPLEREIALLSEVFQKVLHNDKNEENAVNRHRNVSQNTPTSLHPLQNIPHEISQNFIQLAHPAEYVPAAYDPQQFYYQHSEGIYQKLYEELKKEHRVNQKRIEAANYRVGQLEAKLETMIPMLDHRKQKQQLKESEQSLRNIVKKRELQPTKARRMLNSEQMNKWIFAILALFLIAMQPVIWLLQN